jgi:primosomal protein N' (replication factor Y)
LVRVVLRGEEEPPTQLAADELGKQFRAAIAAAETEIRMLGPAPAPIAKLRGCFRYHMQMQSTDGQLLRETVRQVVDRFKMPDKVACAIDVDPVEML